jgi:prepilin-type N-terminal cleavage/methylation domain-containing protein/prepilin-type processing-associated H-X9-DG protein
MKTFPPNSNQTAHKGRANRAARPSGFTLIELLVVIAIIAVLAAILLPALAAAKARAKRMQCASQIRQLALGLNDFPSDNNDAYPPAGWASGGDSNPGNQIAWDCWINRYIGGNLPDNDLDGGVMYSDQGPPVELCPADTYPKCEWVGGGNPYLALRSYAMIACGAGWTSGYQVDDKNRSYPLPNLTKAGMLGVGIYWTDTGSTVDWNAKGYQTSVVRDPSGTILLCENTHGQQVVCNIWTCCCVGPQGAGDLYQIDPAATPQIPSSDTSENQGNLVYQAQQKRFNYAFHDGHVEALRIEQTVGSGTLAAPAGMWSVIAGD